MPSITGGIFACKSLSTMGSKKKAEIKVPETKTTETVVDSELQPVLDSNKEDAEKLPIENTPVIAETVVDSELQPVLDSNKEYAEKLLIENTPVIAETVIDSELQPKFKTLSGKFHDYEMEYIDKVLEARQTTVNKGKPLTRDVNHFIRQCVRFTINHRPNAKFWLPDNLAETLIDT